MMQTFTAGKLELSRVAYRTGDKAILRFIITGEKDEHGRELEPGQNDILDMCQLVVNQRKAFEENYAPKHNGLEYVYSIDWLILESPV